MLDKVKKMFLQDTGWWIFATGVFVGVASLSGDIFQGATLAGFGGSIFHFVRSLTI